MKKVGGYTMIGSYDVSHETVPLALFDDPIEFEQVQTHKKLGCPSVNFGNKRRFYIPAWANIYAEASWQLENNQKIFRLNAPFDKKLNSMSAHAMFGSDTRMSVLIVTDEEGWANGIPSVQLRLPYVFFSDDKDMEIHLRRPEEYQYKDMYPGNFIGGSFNIYSWLRPINAAYQWDDINQPLQIKKGQPIVELLFNKPVHEFKYVPWNNDLKEMMNHTQSINEYTHNTFSHMKTIIKRRPKKLVR